jgi:hypothetical protein
MLLLIPDLPLQISLFILIVSLPVFVHKAMFTIERIVLLDFIHRLVSQKIEE